jgi:hypothetical protein
MLELSIHYAVDLAYVENTDTPTNNIDINDEKTMFQVMKKKSFLSFIIKQNPRAVRVRQYL